MPRVPASNTVRACSWGAVIVSVAFLLVRLLMEQMAKAQAEARDKLAVARVWVSQLRNQMPDPDPLAQEQMANQRKIAFDEGLTDAQDVLNTAKDPVMKAEALIARGDLCWQLASATPLPVATTRPVLNLDATPDKLLELAQQAYEQVLQQYPEQKSAVIAARFGLAAIAENKGDWPKAAG